MTNGYKDVLMVVGIVCLFLMGLVAICWLSTPTFESVPDTAGCVELCHAIGKEPLRFADHTCRCMTR